LHQHRRQPHVLQGGHVREQAGLRPATFSRFLAQVAADGIFGTKTTAATLEFQRCWLTRHRCGSTLNYVVGDHPPAPEGDWVAVAEAEPGARSPARAGLPAEGETFAELAAGFGVGRTAAWRHVDEVVVLLAARAPKLRAAGREAKGQVMPT
jgi:hypothetical protein